MKRCTRCKVEKPAADFTVMAHAADGLHFHCRACIAERRIADREKRRLYNIEWAAKNPELAVARKERQRANARTRKEARKAANIAASLAAEPAWTPPEPAARQPWRPKSYRQQ